MQAASSLQSNRHQVAQTPAACATRPVFIRPERRAFRALASEVGQGTVEYVGLLLLMASVLAAVVAASSQLGGKDQIGKKVVEQVGKSIDKAGKEPSGK